MNGKQYTPEERVVLFDKVAESIEGGLFTKQACELHGLNYHTFRLWCSDETLVPKSNSKYTHAKLGLADCLVEKCFDIVMAPAVTNECGVDKGDVELRKLQSGFFQWVSGRINRGYSEKAHDTQLEQTQQEIKITFSEAPKPE